MISRLSLPALVLSLAVGLAGPALAHEHYESSQILARGADQAKVADLPDSSVGYSAKIKLRLNGEWSEGTLDVAPGKRRLIINDQTTLVDIAAGTVLVMSGADPKTAVELPLSSFPIVPDAGDLDAYAPEDVTWEVDEDFGANSGAFSDKRERQFETVEIIGKLPSGGDIFGTLTVSDDGVIDMFHGTMSNNGSLHRVTRLLSEIEIMEHDDQIFAAPAGVEITKPAFPQ
ncbi:MAG: hypothetical protein Alpg2KO_27320 [Alphaproteobacteria bacterium]